MKISAGLGRLEYFEKISTSEWQLHLSDHGYVCSWYDSWTVFVSFQPTMMQGFWDGHSACLCGIQRLMKEKNIFATILW